MRQEFIIVLVPERMGWCVLFPDLPGCVTQGDSLEEAIALAADAADGHIATMRDLGQEVPQARSYAAVRADSAWATEHGVDWSRATLSRVRVAAVAYRHDS